VVSPSNVCLAVSGLTKRYGPVEAVRGVSFSVAPGEIFGLLGRNGAGKTSIIESILGLRRPDTGSISVSGVDALAHPVYARRSLGAQLQAAALQDKVTPHQALRYFGSFYDQPASAADLLKQFSLSDKADAAFDSLSGGQRQRLFLALAVVNQPSLLVLDEPTAGLDPQSRHELHLLIRQIKESGRSVLMSTHYLDEAQQLCDRIGILHEGRIIATGTPTELVARSSALPQLSFRTRLPVTAALVSGLSAVSAHSPLNDGWLLGTSEVNRTISALAQSLQATGNEMLDLQIIRPSLESVFLELTRTPWTNET